MKPLLASLLALVAARLGLRRALHISPPASAHPLWICRQEALYLSGLLSIALMSLAMFLATRPPGWKGRWAAWTVSTARTSGPASWRFHFAAMHWLIEMSDDILKSTIGRAGRLPKEKFEGLLKVLRDLAEGHGRVGDLRRADHAGRSPCGRNSRTGVALACTAPCRCSI
jgi:hypothetical protein